MTSSSGSQQGTLVNFQLSAWQDFLSGEPAGRESRRRGRAVEGPHDSVTVQAEWEQLPLMWGLHARVPETKTWPLFSRRGANPPAAHWEEPFMRERKNLPWKVRGEQFNLWPQNKKPVRGKKCWEGARQKNRRTVHWGLCRVYKNRSSGWVTVRDGSIMDCCLVR